jgi:SAM-dependent methyltransferase
MPAHLVQNDWILHLKDRLKRNRRLATALFYATDLLYLDLGERRRFVGSFPRGARLLNVGAGFRLSPPGFLAVDVEPYPGVALVASAEALPFADGTIDGLLSEMVLEHLPDPQAATAEMRRVVRPEGRAFVMVPFLWPYHAAPHDYTRWTQPGLARALDGFEPVAAGVAGGPTTTLCNVLHEWLAIALSFDIEALYRALYLLLMPLIFPFKLLDKLLSRHRHAAKIGALYYFHGRRRHQTPARAGDGATTPERRAIR